MTLEQFSAAASIAGSLVGIITVVGGFFWGISRRITSGFEKRDTTIAEIRLALQAVDARAKVDADEVRRELAAYKLDVAQHYATEEGVTRAIEPILKQLEKLNDRLDQLLLNAPPPARARRPT